ncbi:NADH-quinone oxidoreductase subunit L [bacterium]|nr:NADH-quinone oxidoreductase subunit L [bacterium]MBU1937978.1 NADH-quinone oxidoreductase subunit L [bacterium]
MSHLIFLIILFPLIGVITNTFFTRRWSEAAIGSFSSAMVGASFIFSVAAFISLLGMEPSARHIEQVLFSWIHVGNFHAPATLLVDTLSCVMILTVSGVSFLIHIYSIGYMHGDVGFRRYFVFLNLFVFFMLLLVLGNNFLVMFIGWEGVGLCSYLLIGFWYTDEAKATAGKKAFIVNRIGDFGFLLAIFLIWTTFGTIQFDEIIPRMASFPIGSSVITAICLLLFVGAIGKSAQFPLYVWLPDAMAGPTPVSALIHAATMVTAGVYMVARSHFLYSMAPAALQVVAIVGAGTAIFAATIGLVQNDIKKVLAYSTVSQLGYMFLACGVGAYAVAIFHLMTHAFFKALLFLGSGSVIHGMSGEQDIRQMGGLKTKMPKTYWTFLVATLAIAGIPGLSGFFSKDEILWKTFEGQHYVLWVVGVVAAFFTAFYMFRLLYLTFHGKFRGSKSQEHHVHESPSSMTVPLIILAVLAAIGGYVGLPAALGGSNPFEHFLHPVFAGSHAHLLLGETHHGVESIEYIVMLISVVVALLGIWLARSGYFRMASWPGKLSKGMIYTTVLNKYYVDQIYDVGISRPAVKFSDIMAEWFDLGVIDGLVNGVAAFFGWVAGWLRRVQTGFVQNYALLMGAGIILVLASLLYKMFF